MESWKDYYKVCITNRVKGSFYMATTQEYYSKECKKFVARTRKGGFKFNATISSKTDWIEFNLILYLVIRWFYLLFKKFKKEPLYVEPLKDKMKRMQFVEDFKDGLQIFTRGFTRIYVQGNDYFIGHTINKNKTKVALKDIDSYIKYFDRI